MHGKVLSSCGGPVRRSSSFYTFTRFCCAAAGAGAAAGAAAGFTPPVVPSPSPSPSPSPPPAGAAAVASAGAGGTHRLFYMLNLHFQSTIFYQLRLFRSSVLSIACTLRQRSGVFIGML